MTNSTHFQQIKIFSVSEITSLIKSNLESSFPKVWIEGEISNLHKHHSGHLYFTLKDEKSQIHAVMFRSDAAKIKFELKDGQQLLCKGRINVYEPRGEYQLMTQAIEPKGKGALQLAFEQLKEKLDKEGLFLAKHKKKLPLLSKKVGVITSPRGAAIIDIIKTMERRFNRTHIIIYPVKVQGEGASDEIAKALTTLGRFPDIDVIIVGRGGGSIEDLWAFNEEKVARAIFECPIPIISAVGHEVDFTIADFVSDVRASTPSAAAEMVIEKEQSFFDRIDNLEKRMAHTLKYLLQMQKQKVSDIIHHQVFRDFKLKLLNLEQKIDEFDTRARNHLLNLRQNISANKSFTLLMEEKISSIIKTGLHSYKSKWENLSIGLNALSPLNILKKGYSLCWKDGHKSLINKIENVHIQDEITVSFYKGEFECQVKKVNKDSNIEKIFSNKTG